MTNGSNKESSTSLAIARRLAPIVVTVQTVSMSMGIAAIGAAAFALLGKGTPIQWGLWFLALTVWNYFTGSNMRYWATHSRLSVGMIPPALMSLAPAMAIALRCAKLPVAINFTMWIILTFSLFVVVYFTAWFVRFRRAYMGTRTVDPNATILILGGTIRNGKPCTTLLLRLEKAIELWQESPQRTLVPTGGPVANDVLSEADYMATILEAKGVSQDCILPERNARNTKENIRFSFELLKDKGISGQVCVLTSDYHLYRALREGRRNGYELIPIASPTPAKSRMQQWCQEVLALVTS